MYLYINACVLFVHALVWIGFIGTRTAQRAYYRSPHLHLASKNESLNRVLHIQCNNFIRQLNPIERHQLVPNEAYYNNISMTCIECMYQLFHQTSPVRNMHTVALYPSLLFVPGLLHFYFWNCFLVVHTKETGTYAHTANRLFELLSFLFLMRRKWILWLFYSKAKVRYCFEPK